MVGLGEIIGLIGLLGQVVTGAREIFTATKSFEGIPQQVQKVIDGCSGLSEILYQVQSLLSNCDFASPPLQDLRLALAVNITRCHDKIAEVLGKIEHLRSEHEPMMWEKIKNVHLKDFFSDLQDNLSAMRGDLSLWLGLLTA